MGLRASAQTPDAQTLEKKSFKLGYNLGVGFSDLPGLSNHAPAVCATLGVAAQIPLNDRWTLAPELNFSSRNTWKTDRLLNAVPLSSSRTDFETYHIDVPVIIQFQVSPKVFFGAGAQISFLVRANQVTTGTVLPGTTVTVIENLKSLMHKEGFMLPLEVGVMRHQIGGLVITERFRYNLGIMEAFTTSLVESKYQSFQVFITLYGSHRKKA
jgi:hypothetical protein